MLTLLIVAIGIMLAFANGGNDQFKGVATLYGSGVTSFKSALGWATITAALGAIAVVYFGSELIAAFSGKGLVPDSVVAMKSFSLAVGLAAAVTVLLATWIKLPISTTHALIGSLIGAGFMASPEGLNLQKLGSTFFIPLILSPILSCALFMGIYPLIHRFRKSSGVDLQTCVCVGGEVVATAPLNATAAQIQTLYQATIPTISVDSEAVCTERYQGKMAGLNIAKSVDVLHFLSAGAVCFSRALNDVPKLAALLLIGSVLNPVAAIITVAISMLVGGLIQSGRIAETMGKKMTEMNPGQGFLANLITSGIVLSSSRLGLPVSTTHVACGSLFGLGISKGVLQKEMLKKIVLAWVFTLPIAGILSILFFSVLRGRV